MEEVANHPDAAPLVDAPWQARREFRRMRLDTLSEMAISNLVAITIMIGTAATFHAAGKTSIDTAADAAHALQPIAGRLAFLLFSLGIIGTGLLAVPVLAAPTACAVGEARGWKRGLKHRPCETVGFYSVIGIATLLGIGIDSQFDLAVPAIGPKATFFVTMGGIRTGARWTRRQWVHMERPGALSLHQSHR